MAGLPKVLAGGLGPYVAGGVAVILALALAAAGLQSIRLEHAKAELASAHAALINPVTGKSWRTESVAAAADLSACRREVVTLRGAIDAQNAAVTTAAADSARRIVLATKAAEDARAVAESARRHSAFLMAQRPAGATACERAEDARQRFLEVIQ